ncbi:MAG: serine/threonine protein kinase, partial [Acidobacteriota bacterium]|nr:serine/threonine protein kinase [Acidobacteriota bacterium]
MKPRPDAPPSGSKRAWAVFEAALKRKQSERVIFIDGACGGDDALRTAVLDLLDSADLVSTVTADDQRTRIAPLADEPTRIAPPQPSPWRPGQPMEGRRIGPYQLLHSLGKGGMGTVYAASRADQEYKKIVAIKLVTSGLGSAEMLRRFRNERQVLAGLDHPCIAHLLDGGSTDDGLPYLVMEFVEGLPIDKYCDAHALSISDRLKLFQKVCSAVQFAHQNLVVHRDLKPANILVATNGEPKLLDFGIAKLMTAEFSAEEIELNRGEAQPMTLRYASPEQVRGEPITTASDIYSLGVLLYELLAGVHPFKAALTSRSEIEKAIRTQEPAKPSEAVKGRADVATASKLEKQRTAKLVQELCGDIDTIVLTALQKQPRSRYPSAESFSWDITRYLNGFPVYARRDDMGYRARKFVRRHAASVIGAALVIVALIVSSIVSLRFAHTAQAERAKAQNRFDDVRKLAHFVLFDFDDKIRAGETAARKVLVTEAVDYLKRLAKVAAGDVSVQLELFEGYLKVGDRQGNPNVADLGNLAGAKESYSKALRAAEDLRARNPKDARFQHNVARADIK